MSPDNAILDTSTHIDETPGLASLAACAELHEEVTESTNLYLHGNGMVTPIRDGGVVCKP